MRTGAPSVMSHLFSQAPQVHVSRSSFRRSFGHKTAFDAGYLVPFLVDPVLPGDTYNVRLTAFCRMATPVFPIFDNLFLETFFFFVPNRLVWNNFQKFMGEQINPGDSIDFSVPQMTVPGGGYAVGSLQDYMGIPPSKQNATYFATHNTLPMRGYNLIYNEWFRDENLQNSVTVDKGDGPDTASNYVLRRRGKRHDYFTSCLPFLQKGVAVPLPMGGNAPVKGIGTNTNTGPTTPITGIWETAATASTSYPAGWATSSQPFYMRGVVNTTAPGLTNLPQVYADLSAATGATINALRQSFQIQKLLERDARGGTRYIEILRSHFGVISPDARLQRPEYLGGGHSSININPIAQTSSTDVTSPQGNLSAFATATVSNHGFTKSFVEHGYLIGLMCVRADLNYQQGLERHWSDLTRYDFYWPELAHIGEQSVLNKEIYLNADVNDAAVFGYQERYAHYRYKPSLVTGIMRSTAAGTLDKWHLAQNFSSLPVLNSTFIQETPPMDRILAVPTAPEFLFDGFVDMKCARPMPMYSVPGWIDHF